jgi:hypothetical protein
LSSGFGNILYIPFSQNTAMLVYTGSYSLSYIAPVLVYTLFFQAVPIKRAKNVCITAFSRRKSLAKKASALLAQRPITYFF